MDLTPDQIEYAQHMRTLSRKGTRLSVDVEPVDLVVLIVQVQLASRHPENVGYTAGRARAVCEILTVFLDQLSPGLGRLLDKGWDPDFDVKRD